MKTIIYAHPWEGSFNHAILNTIRKKLDEKREEYTIIDLYKESFDPVFSSQELRMYSAGDTPYKQVKNYQNILSKSTELIFIFPIWWFDLPAILKGFLDKVMLKNFAYTEEGEEWIGLLTNIKKVSVITTASMDKTALINNGNAIQGVFINSILGSLGIDKDSSTWIHLGEITNPNNEKREKFLKYLEESL